VGDAQMSGIKFRELLGLRSSDFDFSFDGETFTFTTTGYGHGVGLSQYGADYLARQGKTYQEILEHYYSGATLVDRV
jgi:stage II sporulation protein D